MYIKKIHFPLPVKNIEKYDIKKSTLFLDKNTLISYTFFFFLPYTISILIHEI
jgi:hypothetical protein